MEHEKILQKLHEDRDELFLQKQKIENDLQGILENGEDEKLYQMQEYFQGKEGSRLCGCFSEMLRMAYIINFLILEKKNQKEYGDFLVGIKNSEQLMEKYIQLIFYLRRIEMNYVENKEEIISFIIKNSISPQAIYTVVYNELFRRRDKVLREYYEMMRGTVWETSANQILEWNKFAGGGMDE